ncbi:MAG: AAA family ATPase [Solirubrobacterales bacterium]
MPELAVLLGQDSLTSRLFDYLQHQDTRGVRLTGAPGSGKSFVARAVAAAWRESGGRCIVAIGDDDQSWRDLYPLLSGLSQAPADWAGLAATGGRAVVRAADATVPGPDVGGSIFDLLRATFRQSTDRALKPYSSLERDVIVDLRRLARSRRVLLVADNAHWWDAMSLALLNEVLSDRLRSTVPQLASVVVLLVDTAAEQRPVAADAFESLIDKHFRTCLETTPCDQDMLTEVLTAFGLSRQLPAGVVSELFKITHGHLKLIEQLVAYAEEHDVDALLASDSDYLTGLVAARFATLGTSKEEVTELLARAAILGLSFTERDLSCIADERRSAELRNLIERAEEIGFLESASGRIAFSHDVIRTAVLRDKEVPQLRPLYEKLSQCLSLLRPGDYGARARALLQAGDRERARDLVVLAGVAQIRRGVPATRVREQIVADLPDAPKVISFRERIGAGYAAVDAGDFAKPLPSLQTPEPSDSFAMAAEKNYLAALCLMELETPAAVAQAEAILDSWIPNLKGEVEMRLRFLSLLQQAQIHSEGFEDARRTERTIEGELLRRADYDFDAAVMLQVQNRRAGAVSVPEVAERRIEEAVAFFEEGTGDGGRDQLELFRSLTNLSGIRLKLGTVEAALEVARQAEEIALANPDISHRLDVLASNVVLSAQRSGELGLDKAIARQQMIVESPEGSDDNFIQTCNLICYRLLAGQLDEPRAELELLGRNLQTSERAESFLLYHWTALAVAVPLLCGDRAEAAKRHREMGELVASLRWPAAAYARRRQSLLDTLLPELMPADATAFDLALLERNPHEVGPAWSYYARLIPCCELSFWSDS